jgi:hypothetical protein
MTSIGTCSGCGSRFRVGATAAGTPPRCPKCGGTLEVSEAPSQPAAAAGTSAPRPAAHGAAPASPPPARPPARGSGHRAIAVQAGSSRRNRAATGMWVSVAATGAVAILLLILISGKDSSEGTASPAKPAAGPVAERPSPTPPSPAPLAAAAKPPAPPPSPAAGKPSGTGAAASPPAAEGGEKVVADPAVAAASKPAERILPEIDLSTIPDVPPLKETPAELEKEIRDALAAVIDPYSGAKGSRARVRLIAIGKPAFPAILNALKSLDYDKAPDVETGYAVNRMIEEMAGGKSMLFKNKTDPDSAKWNRHVAKAWIEVFNRIKDDPAKWKTFTLSSTLVDERGRDKPESDPLAPK